MDGPRTPIAMHELLGLQFYPVDKANATVDYLENQLTPRQEMESNFHKSLKCRMKSLFGDYVNEGREYIFKTNNCVRTFHHI
jgi:hypothetical protein